MAPHWIWLDWTSAMRCNADGRTDGLDLGSHLCDVGHDAAQRVELLVELAPAVALHEDVLVRGRRAAGALTLLGRRGRHARRRPGRVGEGAIRRAGVVAGQGIVLGAHVEAAATANFEQSNQTTPCQIR